MALQTGTQAPDFTLKTKTADGFADVKLSDNFGKKNTVLLFFPGAFTDPCTKEMCDVSSGIGAYKSLDAEVYAISCDTALAQEAWAKANGITVTLLSDYAHRVVEAYDVVLPDLLGMGPSSKRAAFVIDKSGVIRYSEETPTPLDFPDFGKVKETLAGLA